MKRLLHCCESDNHWQQSEIQSLLMKYTLKRPHASHTLDRYVQLPDIQTI
jgi:hypothetical protein